MAYALYESKHQLLGVKLSNVTRIVIQPERVTSTSSARHVLKKDVCLIVFINHLSFKLLKTNTRTLHEVVQQKCFSAKFIGRKWQLLRTLPVFSTFQNDRVHNQGAPESRHMSVSREKGRSDMVVLCMFRVLFIHLCMVFRATFVAEL